MATIIAPQSSPVVEPPARADGHHALVIDLPAPRRFTVEEYHRMADAGVFGSDERVELVDGTIFQMPAPSPPHSYVVRCSTKLFYRLCGEPPRWDLLVQDPVRLPGDNEPLPDLALVRPLPRAEYRRRHPGPEDVFLLVEIAASSLDSDRAGKAPRYARAGIRECWIVDLVGNLVEVYREPDTTAGRYLAPVRVARPGDALSLAAFPEVTVAVAELLGAVS